MSDSSCCHKNRKTSSFPYIEPSIRTIAGFLLTIIGVLIYLYNDQVRVLLGFLFFISLNLFQSGITRFCIMEKILRFIGFRSELDEITVLSEETHRAAAIQNNYMKTLNLLNEAVLEVSTDGTIMTTSDGWFKLIGIDASACQEKGCSLLSFVHKSDQAMVTEILQNVMACENEVHKLRFRFNQTSDAEQWIGGKFMLERFDDTDIRIRGVLRDITDAYLQEKQIKHMALHDALTGLPNRVLLEERMEQALAQAKRNQSSMGVLFIDLDNFKQVNDIHGHKTGDHLLVSVSKIMQLRLRATDTLARWGGDEFVVILPELNNSGDMRDVAESLMYQLEDELVTEGFDAIVTLSIGGALYPGDGRTSESLLVQADKALYFAKEQGRNNVQIYAEVQGSNLGYYDFDMTNRFSQAVKDGNIQVFYQPIISSDDKRTCGFEALARWHDSKCGWVSPGVFIPIAENLGLIQNMGRQVLEKAFNDFSSVADYCQCGVVLSVNLSNRQLMQGDFNVWIKALADKYSIKPEQIKLEITESLAQIGIVRAKETLEALRVSGFMLSLDDFGTGYSSLSLLHNLPVHELKIDMSFVQRYANPDGRIMLETIVAMGHSLGLQLVAEGVETLACEQIMCDLGVERLQGYYYSKPLPWEEISRLFVSCSQNFAPEKTSQQNMKASISK